MKKLSKIFLIMILMITIVTGCTTTNNMSDAEKFKEEYESINGQVREKDGKTIRSIEISKYNPFIYKNEDDIVNMINNKETFIVYFGFTDCPWCRSVLPTLISVADELNIDKIYYVNVKDIRDTKAVTTDGKIETTKEGTNGYNELINMLDDVLSDYSLKDANGKNVSAGEKRIFAPNVISVIDGKPTSNESGISSKQTDAYMELSDEIKEDMHKKLKDSLAPIASIIEACNNESGC